MKRLGWSVLFLLMAIGTPSGANLLDDGSFDLAASGTQTSNSAWVLTVNFPDQTNPAAQFEEESFASNDPGAPEKGVWFRSFEGSQNTDDLFAQATLTQTVVVASGGDYTLTFDAKRELIFYRQRLVRDAGFERIGHRHGGPACIGTQRWQLELLRDQPIWCCARRDADRVGRDAQWRIRAGKPAVRVCRQLQTRAGT